MSDTAWKWKEFTFTFRNGWLLQLNIPAFDVFSYDHRRRRHRPKGTYAILLEADNEKDVPSETMVQVFDKVLENPPQLTKIIASALWDDFSGRGPKSGMWWNGELQKVNEVLSDGLADIGIKNADDVLRFISLGGITIIKEQKAEAGRKIINPSNGKVIQRRDIPYRPPVATMHFDADFEQEHALDILTDGKSILGLGYATGAEFYPAS